MPRRRTTTTAESAPETPAAVTVVLEEPAQPVTDELPPIEVPVEIATADETTLVPVVIEPEPEQAPNGEGFIVTVNPEMPWGSWSNPTVVPGKVEDLRVRPEGEDLRVSIGSSELGLLNGEGMRQISMHTHFPLDFVQKLPNTLRAEVINNRLTAAGDKKFAFIGEDNRLTHMVPEWREIVPYSTAAQFAYDELSRLIPGAIEIKEAQIRQDSMVVSYFTELERPVTRSVGDILRLGLEITHNYGMMLGARLYTERLVCLNGMTANDEHFSWRARQQGTINHQLGWLREAIASCVHTYDTLVERAITMAETRLEGDPRQILSERAAALRIPRTLRPALLEAFDQEPGDTEWHLVNAITRLATHSDRISPVMSRQLMNLGGEYTREFTLVDARLPQSLANRIGARIIPTAQPEVIDAELVTA